jgi:hypothetical protein
LAFANPRQQEVFSWLVNLGRYYRVFTQERIAIALKLKDLRMARGLLFSQVWGRRAEDPFRGLRAGPVRFSPFLFLGCETSPNRTSADGDPDAFRTIAILPDTPTKPNTAEVCSPRDMVRQS